eukprot:2709557-Rhodomonas_salina.2
MRNLTGHNSDGVRRKETEGEGRKGFCCRERERESQRLLTAEMTTGRSKGEEDKRGKGLGKQQKSSKYSSESTDSTRRARTDRHRQKQTHNR